ncbi:MAG: hypothetical protein UT91_C0022G0013 [Parcubacteria group bacterium GW2011_GWA2_40_23]|nr:MAG: hypothetical protein UT91_C0022G0013 [Parcubacteria group bacterium GW2011_GWA2_40_23]
MSEHEDGNVWMPIIVIWGIFFAIGAVLFSMTPSSKSPEMCMIPANPLPETYRLNYIAADIGVLPLTPAIAIAATPAEDGGSYIDRIYKEAEMMFYTPTHWPWSIVYVPTKIIKEDSGFSAIWTYEAPQVLYVRSDIFVMRELMNPSLCENDSDSNVPLPIEPTVIWTEEIAFYDTYYEDWWAEQERYQEASGEETSTPTNSRGLRDGLQNGGTRHKMTLGS